MVKVKFTYDNGGVVECDGIAKIAFLGGSNETVLESVHEMPLQNRIMNLTQDYLLKSETKDYYVTCSGLRSIEIGK